MIVGFLGKEGFKWWNTLPISKDEERQKNPEAVFKAITDTLEVSTSYWNHIDEMYSWHQTGRTQDNWPIRSTYQRNGRKVPVPNQSWENGT